MVSTLQKPPKGKRKETRLPVSFDTRTALKSLLRNGESYDSLIRRMMVTGIPKLLVDMTQDQRAFVDYIER